MAGIENATVELTKAERGRQSECSELLYGKPSQKQLHDACLYYRHDYGLMGPVAQEKLRSLALSWLDAWRKAFGAR
jgi:hypothetical protein